jgi:hypothetical protein
MQQTMTPIQNITVIIFSNFSLKRLAFPDLILILVKQNPSPQEHPQNRGKNDLMSLNYNINFTFLQAIVLIRSVL